MPKVPIRDKRTGIVHQVEWNQSRPPTRAEFDTLIKAETGVPPPTSNGTPDILPPAAVKSAPMPQANPGVSAPTGMFSKITDTMYGGEHSVLPAIPGITRPLAPAFEDLPKPAYDELIPGSRKAFQFAYENLARPSTSIIGAASDAITGKVAGAAGGALWRGGKKLAGKFLQPAVDAISPLTEKVGAKVATAAPDIPAPITGPRDMSVLNPGARVPVQKTLPSPSIFGGERGGIQASAKVIEKPRVKFLDPERRKLALRNPSDATVAQVEKGGYKYIDVTDEGHVIFEKTKEAAPPKKPKRVSQGPIKLTGNSSGMAPQYGEIIPPKKPPIAAGSPAPPKGTPHVDIPNANADDSIRNFIGRTLADAQKGAMLTGPAIAKSGLGSVGGLTSELLERALTQSPSETLMDFGKVAKSIPGGVKRMGKALRGVEDIVEGERHLAKPGFFSKPAIRAMSTLDAPSRNALEKLGLSADDALARVLNSSPRSQAGKDFMKFLRKHPVIKNIVAPVGANTSVNVLEQGALRTPGINLLKGVRSMDPKASVGKAAARGALGVAAAVGGKKSGDELGEKNFVIKGLLAALAGPYALPFGVGLAFSNQENLNKALDNVAQALGREAPIRIPGQGFTKPTTEIKRRFTPTIFRAMEPEKVSNSRPRKGARIGRPGR